MAAPMMLPSKSFWIILVLGLGLRLGLLLYGEWQDRNMAVKFTDIDYHVFTDAARFVYQNKSPYQRATYRYTPLLAWLLQPNISVNPAFGKLAFIILDIFTGFLIYAITSSNGVSAKLSTFCSALWLLNPLPMTVSSRGNAESIMSALVLLTLKLLQDSKPFYSGTVFALAVHFKIYPVVYALPIYLFLGDRSISLSNVGWKERLKYLLPNMNRLCFICTAGLVLASLTWMYFIWYGWEFLEHTYLYHVTRQDIRHNFSPYFYMLYQQTATQQSTLLALLCFIPQVALMLVFSFKYYKEPALAFFLNTYAFVTFNKVCTSQYFLWYLCLLPLVLPLMARISKLKAAVTLGLWFAGQGLWLLPAYYLEFEGLNTFLYIWAAGLVFLFINCYIMYVIMDHYRPIKTQSDSSEAKDGYKYTQIVTQTRTTTKSSAKSKRQLNSTKKEDSSESHSEKMQSDGSKTMNTTQTKAVSPRKRTPKKVESPTLRYSTRTRSSVQ
ncbi:GPI mannosyltransferase 1-like isoform X2 [Mya arenaria]|uniref:GPI mannosyltransferase 1-like isoform X2 n=1 Tax=Mya arenaria TaxID=6604 RepID=UPI0022E41732|nr:GPI mannosyltransferase 1-like isoform X2 [Mya arenaria]